MKNYLELVNIENGISSLLKSKFENHDNMNNNEESIILTFDINDFNEYNHQLLAEHIIDEESLIYLINNHPDDNVRSIIAKNPNLKNEEVLKNIALHDENPSVRGNAIDNPNLKDESFRIMVANNEKENYWPRICAIRKIEDKQNLINIGFNSDEKEVRSMAMSKIYDEKILEKYFFWEEDTSCRWRVTENITNEDTLKKIVKTEKSYFIKSTAIDKITDELFLLNIMASEKDEKIRNIIIKKINNQDALFEILKKETDYYVIKNGAKKIKDIDRLLELLDITGEEGIYDEIKKRLKLKIKKKSREFKHFSQEQNLQCQQVPV